MLTLRKIAIVIVWLAALVVLAVCLCFAIVWVIITGGGGGPKGGLPLDKKEPDVSTSGPFYALSRISFVIRSVKSATPIAPSFSSRVSTVTVLS